MKTFIQVVDSPCKSFENIKNYGNSKIVSKVKLQIPSAI